MKNKSQPQHRSELKKLIIQQIELLGSDANLNHIDTSLITNMRKVFYEMDFTGDISEWDVSNVKNMDRMFANGSFNGDLSKWDVSKVEDFDYIFHRSDFNNTSPIDWDVNTDHRGSVFGVFSSVSNTAEQDQVEESWAKTYKMNEDAKSQQSKDDEQNKKLAQKKRKADLESDNLLPEDGSSYLGHKFQRAKMAQVTAVRVNQLTVENRELREMVKNLSLRLDGFLAQQPNKSTQSDFRSELEASKVAKPIEDKLFTLSSGSTKSRYSNLPK